MRKAVRHNKPPIRSLLYAAAAIFALFGLCFAGPAQAGGALSGTTSSGTAAPGQPLSVQNGQLQPLAAHTQSPMVTKTTATPTAYYYNWSGYAATTSRPFVAVRSVYIQPAVTCTAPGAWSVYWVGFDGFTNGTVEQAGTAAQCGTGKPTLSYYAWWEMYSKNPVTKIMTMPITIKPGDKIEDTVTYNASNGQYSLSVADLTNTSQHYTKVATCAAKGGCARQSAEWIVERPTFTNGAYAPLNNWKSARLTTDQAAVTTTTNRTTKAVTPVFQSMSTFSYTAIDMIDYPYTGEILASPGPLDAAGVAFSDTWQATQ